MNRTNTNSKIKNNANNNNTNNNKNNTNNNYQRNTSHWNTNLHSYQYNDYSKEYSFEFNFPTNIVFEPEREVFNNSPNLPPKVYKQLLEEELELRLESTDWLVLDIKEDYDVTNVNNNGQAYGEPTFTIQFVWPAYAYYVFVLKGESKTENLLTIQAMQYLSKAGEIEDIVEVEVFIIQVLKRALVNVAYQMRPKYFLQHNPTLVPLLTKTEYRRAVGLNGNVPLEQTGRFQTLPENVWGEIEQYIGGRKRQRRVRKTRRRKINKKQRKITWSK